MSIWERFERINPRYIFLLMFIVLILPMIRPIGLPVYITPLTQALYDWVEELPPGSVVLFDAAYAPGSAAEIEPTMRALLHQCFQNDVKVVQMAQWELGALHSADVINEMAELYGKEYGVDYATVGWRAGAENWFIALRDDFIGAMTATDMAGNDLRAMPLTRDLVGVQPQYFDGVVCFASGNPGVDDWVTYNPNMSLFVQATAVQVPTYMRFVETGQIEALLSGQSGGAQYEQLVGELGEASRLMDPQGAGHLLIITLMVLGNIAYIVNRRKRAASS